jgi:hypothetical protein
MFKRKQQTKLLDIPAPKTVPVFKTQPMHWTFIGNAFEEKVAPGDLVHFDWGGECWGYVTEIRLNRGGPVLFIKNERGFTSDWLIGKTEFRYPAEHCWFAK